MYMDTFESAFVNGEFSPLEALKSLDRENYMLRRDLEKVRRKRSRLMLRVEELEREAVLAHEEFVRLENMSKRMVNELWDTIDALRKNMDIIEGR